MFDKEKTMSTKEVTCYLLNLYVVLSLVFICITLYTNVKVQYGNYMYNNWMQVGMNQWWDAWYKQAVSEALSKSKVCEPFSLFAWEDSANLINIECLQPSNSWNQQPAPAAWNLEPISATWSTEAAQ